MQQGYEELNSTPEETSILFNRPQSPSISEAESICARLTDAERQEILDSLTAEQLYMESDDQRVLRWVMNF